MSTTIRDNTAVFTTDFVAKATGGSIVRGDKKKHVGVTSDSRAVTAGGIFVALQGE